MNYSQVSSLLAAVSMLIAVPAIAQVDWVQKSNEHSQIVLDAIAKFNPENAGSIGVDGLDEEILDLRERLYERDIEDSERVLGELHLRLAEESHPAVRQDLGILIKVVEDSIHTTKLNRHVTITDGCISECQCKDVAELGAGTARPYGPCANTAANNAKGTRGSKARIAFLN